jgi:hypothetical protein
MTETKLIVDCSTGEQTQVPLTPEELADRETARLAWEAEQAEQEAQQAAQAQAEATAIAKLQALGLTAAEITALKS